MIDFDSQEALIVASLKQLRELSIIVPSPSPTRVLEKAIPFVGSILALSSAHYGIRKCLPAFAFLIG
jgi:hypothetical protein